MIVTLHAAHSWDFPGKNTGVGCPLLLQEIFLIQGVNPCLLHWQVDSLPLSHLGSPFFTTEDANTGEAACPHQDWLPVAQRSHRTESSWDCG